MTTIRAARPTDQLQSVMFQRQSPTLLVLSCLGTTRLLTLADCWITLAEIVVAYRIRVLMLNPVHEEEQVAALTTQVRQFFIDLPINAPHEMYEEALTKALKSLEPQLELVRVGFFVAYFIYGVTVADLSAQEAMEATELLQAQRMYSTKGGDMVPRAIVDHTFFYELQLALVRQNVTHYGHVSPDGTVIIALSSDEQEPAFHSVCTNLQVLATETDVQNQFIVSKLT